MRCLWLWPAAEPETCTPHSIAAREKKTSGIQGKTETGCPLDLDASKEKRRCSTVPLLHQINTRQPS